MSLALTFTGSLLNPFFVYTNAVVFSAGGQPPSFQPSAPECLPGLQCPSTQTCYNHYFSPNDLAIQWSSNANDLNGLSINQVLSRITNIPYKLTQTFTFTQTNGTQEFWYGNNEIFLINSDGTQFSNTQAFQLSGANTGDGITDGNTVYTNNPSFTYQIISDNNSQTIFRGIQSIGWNNVSIVVNTGICNATLQMQMTTILEITCNSSDFGSGFCLNFCQNPNNQQLCFNTYYDLCLVNTDTQGDPVIFNNNGCQTYFSDFLANIGPNDQIDTQLNKACSKITGFEDFKAQTSQIQTICACHLNQSFYDELKNSLSSQFPGTQLIAEPERCLFPPCVGSVYKTNSVGKVCPLPACINIASITNNGSVGGSNIINQGDTKCVNAVKPGSANDPSGGGNGGNGNTTPKSWIDQHWMWIVIGVAIVIILILVIIIIAASGTKKKSKDINLSSNIV